MAIYFGDNAVIGPGAKIGPGVITGFGIQMPSAEEGLDGWSLVDVRLDMPSLAREWIEGDVTRTSMFTDATITQINASLSQFPNLATFIIGNADSVIGISNTAFDGTKVLTEGTIIVPASLEDAYKAQYPAWAEHFDSWQTDIEFEIPTTGAPTTLTVDWVNTVVAGASDPSIVTKLIIPVYFTDYEAGAIDACLRGFPSLTTLRTCYEAGSIEIDFLDYLWQEIIAKIKARGSTLDAELVLTRYTATNMTQKANIAIVPPTYYTSTKDYLYSQNPLYIGKVTSANTTNIGNFIWGMPNLLFVDGFEPTSENGWASGYVFYSCNSLKRVKGFDATKLVAIEGGSWGLFYGSSLKEIYMTGMRVSFWLNKSTAFERNDLVRILNDLETPSTTQTLTIGATNLAKLTEADRQIAYDKNWQLA